MDPPQVQLPGSERPGAQSQAQNEPNSTQNTSNSVEIDMGGTQETTTQNETATEGATLPDAQPEAEAAPEPPTPAKKPTAPSFLNFLTSPVVEIEVGEGDNQTVLTAHQTLLLESPFLKELVDAFDESGPRRIKLSTENVEAFSCFLEFQYTHDYTVAQNESPEPSNINDDSGEQLLKHARIYTLAEKLGMPSLKSLAHKKIHTVNGTPVGELSYARYVYTHTRADDTTIRKPVASYWASRGHVLRHDLTEEFKTLCTEVPEFTYDVLSIIMDRKEKTGQTEADSSIRGSARKRLRSEK